MKKPKHLQLEEVYLAAARSVAKLVVDDSLLLGDNGAIAEAQLSARELRLLAAKSTEIADWLERAGK